MGRDVLALDRYNINSGCMGFTDVIEGKKGKASVGTGHGPWSLGEGQGITDESGKVKIGERQR